MKKLIIIPLLMIAIALTIIGHGETVALFSGDPQTVSEPFSMGEDLQTAITQLCLSYETFDSSITRTAQWQEVFLSRFIQNSRMSYAYLDQCIDHHNGEIGLVELNEIHYSLTGEQIDFSNWEMPISALDASSPENYGWMTDWSSIESEGAVIVTASVSVGYGQLRSDNLEQRQITVHLVRNDASCFDGYSISTLTSEIVTPWIAEIPLEE